MRTWNNLYKMLKNGEMDQSLIQTGCEDINAYRTRATEVMNGFEKTFGVKEDTLAVLCSAPGRTEICGNHTDHQHGHVLAAAVNLDFLACVSPNGTQTVHFQSEGWPMTTVDLSDLKPQEAEKETTASLVRGVMAELAKAGYTIGGFDMYAVSNVLPGSGLSSSAACEILLGVAGNHLFCQDELDAVTLAKIGQKAELGLALCIVDCGADHAALTGEYASIPQEMEKVAAFFGKKVLREVQEEEVLKAMPQLRRAVGDRAVLRALHFYADDRRAMEEADALERRDRDTFLQLVKESGRSSWELLQNITPAGAVEAQDMAVALVAAETALNGRGACRVHGGGFAGTIQAFVPTESVSEFCEKMELMLRKGCCHVLNIRPAGGIVL